MNTRSPFIVLPLLALGVLYDAHAQGFRAVRPRVINIPPAQMAGGAQSELDRIAPASSLSPATMPQPRSGNLPGRRLLVPQQYATIQTGIDSAAHGDTVLVSVGTYYENITFRGKAIVVASQMILNGDTTTRNNTIINGSQPSDPNRASVVSFVSGEDTTSMIYGFTITGGTGTLYANGLRVGGGIYCSNSGARILRNKIVLNSVANNEGSQGGGIGSWPRGNPYYSAIEENLIESNSATAGVQAAGGGIVLDLGRIVRNTIRQNSVSGSSYGSFGGGIHAWCDANQGRTHLDIIDNTISDNQAVSLNGVGSGGGLDVEFPNLRLEGNLISNNRAHYGGGIAGGWGDWLIANNVFRGNQGQWWGGAMGIGQDSGQSNVGRIICNTFADNASDSGGAMALWHLKTLMMNTISWANDARRLSPEILVEGGELNVAYSGIRWGSDSIRTTRGGRVDWLDGNITTDPAFLDTTMRLADTSPCIGAGIDSMQIDGIWLHAPPFSFYGTPRPTPAGCSPDIGACENPSCTPADVPLWKLVHTLSGSPPIYSICTVSDRVAWIGSFDTLYRTTNSGLDWIPTPTSPTTIGDIVYIEALSADTVFVGGGGPGCTGGNARIYRTTDGGQTWSIVYTALGTTSYWNAIHFFDSQNAIALSDPPNPGERFFIIKSTDAGVTWTPIADPPIPHADEYGTQNMYFFDSLNGWFGTGYLVSPTNAGRVFRTTDGGNTWTGYPSGNTGWVPDVRFVSPTVGIRISYTAPFLTRSTDGGQTWTTVSDLPVADIADMQYATGVNTPVGSQLWVDGFTLHETPYLLMSTDGGATWEEQTLPRLTLNHLPCLSAVSFGPHNDSVQAFGATRNRATGQSGGEILSYRQPVGTTIPAVEPTSLPTGYCLSQNYPNPFNPRTSFEFNIPRSGLVTLKIYDLLGRDIATLVNDVKPPGTYTVQWDANNHASGVYFYRMQAGEYTHVKRMLLMK